MKLLSIAMVFGASLFGALPPLAQSEREIKALLSDGELYALLGSGETIRAIVSTETGYVVMTNHLLLRADCEYLANEAPGPREFRFHLHVPIDLSTASTEEITSGIPPLEP